MACAGRAGFGTQGDITDLKEARYVWRVREHE